MRQEHNHPAKTDSGENRIEINEGDSPGIHQRKNTKAHKSEEDGRQISAFESHPQNTANNPADDAHSQHQPQGSRRRQRGVAQILEVGDLMRGQQIHHKQDDRK